MSFENPMRPDNEGGISISQAWHAALERAELAERKNAKLREALERCLLTLTDPRIGRWDYMEGTQIYVDFDNATDVARAALANC